MLGVIVSPVPMQFRRHELEQIVDLTGARAILAVRALKGADYAANAVELAAGRSLQVLCLGDDGPPGTTPFMPGSGHGRIASAAAGLRGLGRGLRR